MKVCIFTQGLPVHTIGGAETHVQDLAEGLARRGHSVTIITAPHPQGLKIEEKQNLKIYYISKKPRFTKEMFYRESARVFKELNEAEKFDLVHSQHSWGAGYVKYTKGALPLVVTVHGTFINEFKNVFLGRSSFIDFLMVPFWLKYYLFDDPVVLRRACRVIAGCNELKEDAKRHYRLPEKKLRVIPSAADVEKFRPASAAGLRRSLGLTDEKVLLSIGRVERQKGIQLLLQALPGILKDKPDVKVFVVGTGPYLEHLKKLAQKLGVAKEVVFTGRVDDQVAYYNLADIVVLPTLRLEGLPTILLEAAACGKPSIASNIGGVPTAIDHYQDGILVTPGSLKELKEKILELLSNEDLAKKLGRNARVKAVAKFSLNKMVEDTIKVYRECIAGGRHS